MSWYLLIKFLHIIAATITIGGIFSRQLVRGIAKKSAGLTEVASLTAAALRMDRMLIIPSSNVMVLMGIALAVIQKWPLFGFLQGSSQNWLLVSNLLFIVIMAVIFVVIVPHNKKVENTLQIALAKRQVTAELMRDLDNNANNLAHHAEEFLILIVAGLMVFKPF